MKRILYCFFTMLLCALCLFACGGGDAPASSSSTTSEKKDPNITFVDNEVTLSVGESVQLEVVTSQNNVFVFWSIRDTDLARVSNDGVVTALAEGQTICYAQFAGEKVMCLVKITAQQAQPMLSISVPYADNSITLFAGDSIAIKATVKLGDEILDNVNVEYVVDATEVVRVENGKVIGLQAGAATVTVTATYEGQTAVLSLTANVVEK